jgi:hypothetical protein
MEVVMHVRTAVAVSVAIGTAAGCRLDPLVDDTPGASGHVLPAGSTVPSAADSPEVANQIMLNDGIDDKVLAINEMVIPRGTGASAGGDVHYWSFGFASRAPAPLFEFFRRAGSELVRIDHPAMVEALPGERSYNPLHSVTRVIVTDRYAGELITSADALADAIDLGLVEDPAPTGEFVASPIVLPGTRLEVSDKTDALPASPQLIYGHGYLVGMFEIGAAHRLALGFLPTSQVSFLRESNRPAYDASRPIFQIDVPAKPATVPPADYTPLSVVINIDLTLGTRADDITMDRQLFTRDKDGAIVSTTNLVQQLQITTSMLVLPIQFDEDEP